MAAERNESRDGLLCPYLEFDPTCTNPVVLRATAQVRRMINSIIRHYGLPDVIRVEVAKDLKRSKHEKAIIAATNKANKDSNEQAKKDLVAFYGLPNDAHVSSADFEKMWLYREQFGQDPYTGKGINVERMLNDRDYVEIDHILPFSRSCDDSKSNKVLCLTKSNRDKANRTPYEWMTSGEPSARSAAKQIPCNGQWLTDVLGNADPDSTMVAVETFADWSMARSVIFLVAKLLGFLAAGSDTPMKDTGFARYYVERLDKTLWCIPFAFNPFFSSGKRGCRLLTDKLTDYRSYQQLAGILTHREKIGDFGTEDIFAEVFGSASFDESGAAFILTAPISSEKYISLFDGWNDKAERNYLLCTQVGCSQRSDAENIINALIGSVSNLAVSYGQISLGWETDTSARFSDRPVPSVKRNSLFAELLYRIVYRDSLNIGICRNCGAPFLQNGIGSLNDVCSQACRMAQRRKKGLA